MEICATSAFFTNAFFLSYVATNATFTMYAHNTIMHSLDIMDVICMSKLLRLSFKLVL